MKIQIWWSGRTKAPINQIVSDYHARLSKLNPVEIREFSVKKLRNKQQLVQAESNSILKHLDERSFVILLDEKGDSYTSRDFATFLEKSLQSSYKHLTFILGGPYGFSQALKSRAQQKISLSKMTFTHDMARALFMEQLYRAFTIKLNQPYHHD